MMKIVSNEITKGALLVTQQLQDAGFIAYWAGGCVRDMLMARVPKDYDVATNAAPAQVMRLFPRTKAVGKSFGVVRVPANGHEYEVATFRKDHVYKDGRHPESVTFSDPRTDAMRRDFSINALFFDPLSGIIHDFVKGQDDIAKREIRTVGDPDRRLQEDHLRMLRAIRFVSTLNFVLDQKTAEAIQRSAPQIGRVSAERIQQELTRILLESQRSGDAVVHLQKVGLLREIFPEVEAMKGQKQPIKFHPEGDVFTHTVLMLNDMKNAGLQLAYAVLLHDIGKPRTAKLVNERIRFDNHAKLGAAMAEQICKRIRLSSEDTRAVSFCIGNHMRFMEVRNMKRSTLFRLVGASTFPIELELHALDCRASHGDLGNYEFLLEFQRECLSKPVLPKPWITGHDVLALGVPKGPQIGKWKQLAYDAQLEGRFENRDDTLAWLTKHILSADKK